MLLLSSTPAELNYSQRRIFMAPYTACRAQFYESLGSSAIELRVEYLDENMQWAELTPWAAGSAGNGNVLRTSDEVDLPWEEPKADALVRVVARGNGLLSPIIRMVSLEVK